MIPKTIHTFWFSNDPIPDKLLACMNPWQEVLPEYTIQKWDLNSFTVRNAYCNKAILGKKWAFLSDYARLWVLYHHGGIYLDTDVWVVKSFNDLSENKSFWGTADNGMVEPVVIGSEAGNPLVKACLDSYDALEVNDAAFQYLEIPRMILPVFEKAGFNSSLHEKQSLADGLILPYSAFCPMPFQQADTSDFLQFKTNNTYAIHLWNANWFDPFRFFWNGRKKAGWKAVFNTIFKNPIQSFSFYKNVFYHLKCMLIGYPK